MSTQFIVQSVVGCSLVFLSMAQSLVSAENQTTQANPALKPNISEEDLRNAMSAAESWLGLVDQGKYENSWETGALTFQFTISKKEWNIALDKLRRPLGKLVSRQILEQRVAENPKGLPSGEYVVLYYKTAFSNRPEANELLTLQKQANGQFKLLTYHVR